MAASGAAVGPSKAANAGGVAVSALEMSQNSERLHWTASQVDSKLKAIMVDIHSSCVEYGTTAGSDGKIDYVKGANVAAFRKIADGMFEQGAV